MIPIIAEASLYNTEQLGLWVAIALALIAGGVGIKKLTTRNPPLHREFASKEEHDQLAKLVTQHIDRTDQRFVDVARASSASREKLYNLVREQGSELRAEIKDDNKGVHNRITELLGAVRELQGQIKASSKQ